MRLKQALTQLRNKHTGLEANRRGLQELSAAAQRLSKQAIFALQRGDGSSALKLLNEARGLLIKGKNIIKHDPRLLSEGIWRAALEEYCEASFFEKAVSGKDLFPPQDVTEDTDILLGALSDLIGEMVRQAVNAAIERDKKKVDETYALAQELVDFFLSLDLTGNLRNKADQARQHLRRLEEVRYDLSKY